VEHLLDHASSARFCGSFGLDDDPVSNVNVHLRLAPLSVRACRAADGGEVSAAIRKSRDRLRARAAAAMLALLRDSLTRWPAAVCAAGQRESSGFPGHRRRGASSMEEGRAGAARRHQTTVSLPEAIPRTGQSTQSSMRPPYDQSDAGGFWRTRGDPAARRDSARPARHPAGSTKAQRATWTMDRRADVVALRGVRE
jgi:hypothetical protein